MHHQLSTINRSFVLRRLRFVFWLPNVKPNGRGLPIGTYNVEKMESETQSNLRWCSWLAFPPVTRTTRVQIPDGERKFFVFFFPLAVVVGRYGEETS